MEKNKPPGSIRNSGWELTYPGFNGFWLESIGIALTFSSPFIGSEPAKMLSGKQI
jgi:hypothetical protein